MFAEFLKNIGSYDVQKCSQLVPQELEAFDVWISGYYLLFAVLVMEDKFHEMTTNIALSVHCGVKRNVSFSDTGDIAKVGGGAVLAGGAIYAASKNIGLSLLGAIAGGGGFAYYLNKKYGNAIKNWDYLKDCPALQQEVKKAQQQIKTQGYIK